MHLRGRGYETRSSETPIVTDFQLDKEAHFEYCRDRQFFVLVVPYAPDGRIVLERVFFENGLKWSLAGSGLPLTGEEDFISAAHRICSSYGEHLKLADITPVAFLRNNFHFESRHCHHLGIVFIGRLRDLGDLEDRYFSVPLPVEQDDVFPRHNAQAMPAVIRAIQQRIQHPVADFDSEIESSEEMAFRYQAHNTIVKPVIGAVSRLSRKLSKSAFTRKIMSIIGAPGTRRIIDVACGESSTCSILAQSGKYDFVVGNDVAFSQIRIAQRNSELDPESRLIYTNHDARAFPFASGSFDLAYMKDVLHHMPSRSAIAAVIQECARIAKKFVVIEIENPRRSYISSRALNLYYVKFLRDDYVEFLDKETFQGLFRGYNVEFRRIEAFQGAYNIAIVRGASSEAPNTFIRNTSAAMTRDETIHRLNSLADQGRCRLKKVGSFAILEDGRIISAFNAMPPETGLDCLAGDCPRCLSADHPRSFGYDVCGCLHAEEMLLCRSSALGLSLARSTIYCSYQPCISCTRKLLSSRVSGIRYLEKWTPPESVVAGISALYERLHAQFPGGSCEF